MAATSPKAAATTSFDVLLSISFPPFRWHSSLVDVFLVL
jgi:hypothetical protein